MMGVNKKNTCIIAVICVAMVLQVVAVVDLCHAGIYYPLIAFLGSEAVLGLIGYANLKPTE